MVYLGFYHHFGPLSSGVSHPHGRVKGCFWGVGPRPKFRKNWVGTQNPKMVPNGPRGSPRPKTSRGGGPGQGQGLLALLFLHLRYLDPIWSLLGALLQPCRCSCCLGPLLESIQWLPRHWLVKWLVSELALALPRGPCPKPPKLKNWSKTKVFDGFGAFWHAQRVARPRGSHLPPVKPCQLDPRNHPQAKPCFSKGVWDTKLAPAQTGTS